MLKIAQHTQQQKCEDDESCFQRIMNNQYLRGREKLLNLPEGENMMSATSISHKTESSYAFLMRPERRFEKVT